MIQVTILAVGRAARGWASEAQQDYLKRLQGKVQVNWRWFKDNSQLVAAVQQSSDPIWILDERGKQYDSVGLSKQWMSAGARLTLVVGGADGLPAELRQGYPLLSLSKLTLPHQIAHLLLIEQLYRALTIAEGHPYHK